MRNIVAAIIVLISVYSLHAQDFSNIRFENSAYVNDIKSIQLNKSGYKIGFPIITLSSGEQLTLTFDDLAGDGRYLKYTFIHCSHDWQPDGMNQIEYLDGFQEDEITEYGYSFNTITSYTHYTLNFPSQMMRITRSGNYILYVYDDTPENPVLTRRFMVIEPNQAEIVGKVDHASDVSVMHHRQEVDFVANTASWNIRNPAQYLHATILQNGRWDKAITGLRYRAGKPGEYSFDYDDGSNTFEGGSEFRVFDTKSLKYNGTHIVSFDYQHKKNQAYLLEDLARPFGPYVSANTLKGKCYYKNEDFEGENREDYVETHFTLKSDEKYDNGRIFVFGELTDWRLLPEAEMHFVPALDAWEAVILLKQGYYNYQYVFVPDKGDTIDETHIEGSHWETNNEYYILLYLQEEGSSYDRLIGFTLID